jgi:hypothetical protein
VSEQEHAPAELGRSAAERAASAVLPASGLVWTAAEIMHLAGQPGAVPVAVATALAATAAWGAAARWDRVPRQLPAWLAIAGGWLAAAAAEGPLSGWPHPPLTIIGAAVAGYGWWKAQHHEAVTGAREWRAQKAGWLGRSRQWGLGGTHLLGYRETLLGEQYEFDTRGTRKRASAFGRGHEEYIAEREGLPAAWVTIARHRLAGRATLKIRRIDPWGKPPAHPALAGDPDGILDGPCSVRRPVIIGEDPETGDPLEVPLWDPERGALNVNIVSMAGGGKTVLLNNLSERITAAPDAVMVRVNPSVKGSAEVKRWGVACHLTALGTRQGSRAVQVLRAVNAIIEYRAQQDSDTDIFVPSPRDPLIVVIIDESDAVAKIAAARAEVDKIATKGREYGVALVKGGQRGTADYGSAAQRSQDSVVCLGGVNRPGEAYHAAGSMGLSIPDMTSYGDGKPGVWLVIRGSSWRAGRTFLLKEPPDIYRIARERAFTQPELPAGCRAFLDEHLKGQYALLLSTDVFAQWAREQQGVTAPLPDGAQHGQAAEAVPGTAPAAVPVATLTETDVISSLDWEPDMDDDMRSRLAAIDARLGGVRKIIAETAALPMPPEVPAEALAASTAERWRQVGEQAQISPDHREIMLGLLKEGTTIGAVSKALGVTTWTARTYLQKLKDEGVARLEGKGRGSRWHTTESGDAK